MTALTLAPLTNRAILKLSGEDRVTFLQGLVSCDVTKVSESQATWGAYLTPQGKFLHEFFIIAQEDALLLDCEAERLEDLMSRLKRFKLRSKIALEPLEGLAIHALFGGGAAQDEEEPGALRADAPIGDGGHAYLDPRLSAAGLRIIAPVGADLSGFGAKEADFQAYDAHRIALGLPDGAKDIELEKGLLLEYGFEELGGVDFKKGCYMGQELTARTKYRGLVKKRLFPAKLDKAADLEPGTAVRLGDKAAGEVRSVNGDQALVFLKLEPWRTAQAEGGSFTVEDQPLTISQPDWMVVAEPKE